MGFSKTLLTEQTTGYHKVEDTNLMYICMWLLFWRMTIIISFFKQCFGNCISPIMGYKGWECFFWVGSFIKSHPCSLNPVITNSVTGPPEFENFLHLQLMMETGPVLETQCLEELKRMGIFQNISCTGCNNVHSCCHMSLRSHTSVCSK
jgi:hypothetical protein